MEGGANVGKAQRVKGHSFERKTAILFREFYPEAKRHLEYQSQDAEAGIDVIAGPFNIQCKRKKSHCSINTIKEVKQEEGKTRLLISKPDRDEAMVVIGLDDFLNIVRRLQSCGNK